MISKQQLYPRLSKRHCQRSGPAVHGTRSQGGKVTSMTTLLREWSTLIAQGLEYRPRVWGRNDGTTFNVSGLDWAGGGVPDNPWKKNLFLLGVGGEHALDTGGCKHYCSKLMGQPLHHVQKAALHSSFSHPSALKVFLLALPRYLLNPIGMDTGVPLRAEHPAVTRYHHLATSEFLSHCCPL